MSDGFYLFPWTGPNCPQAWRDPVAFENGTRLHGVYGGLYAGARKREARPRCTFRGHYRDTNKRVSIPPPISIPAPTASSGGALIPGRKLFLAPWRGVIG